MPWTVETLDQTVDEELTALSPELRARFVRIAQLIETVGLERVHEPHVKHVEGRLWENSTGWRHIARALYVTAAPRRVVVVRVFVKKTEKTPRREIGLAARRAQGVR